MLNGAFALLERSLRIDSRAWSSHLARLGLLIAIYFSLVYALLTASFIGAPGLNFFSGIAFLDAMFMTLLGVGFFATTITEEKEEDTLGLMLMAGISPLGILSGKSGGRLFQALLLIAVQYPFVLLAETMGGVMQAQVWSVTIALLAYMIFLAGFGLLCSTLAPSSQSASAWMVCGLLVYFIAPMVAAHWFTLHASWQLSQGGSQSTSLWWTLVEWLSSISVFAQMGIILSTGFAGTAWSFQVISNTLAGILCAGLAWSCFGIATRSPSSEANSRGLVTKQRKRSLFAAGRPWLNPFRWKDFHFVSGGIGMVCLRCLFYGVIGIILLWVEEDGGWFSLLVFLLWFSVVIDAARVVARSMQDEVRGQTLSSLMLLPRSLNEVVYSKLSGAILGWLPAPLFGFLIVILSPTLREAFYSLLTNSSGSGFVLVMIVLFSALIPHFAALLSLYVRWGAVALAIGVSSAVYVLVAMVETILMMSFGGMGMNQEILVGSMTMIFLFLCIACHVGILLRVQSLATR